MSVGFLEADWLAPPGVRAGCTLRSGGVSAAPYASLNLGTHVSDEPAAVVENRQRVRATLQLPAEPLWLQQEHGVRVIDADLPGEPGPADGAVTRLGGRVLAILVADCMPVLFASQDGSVLAVAHAGWRGLAAGVLEATVAAMDVDPKGLSCWTGPHIGPDHFEVGDAVRAAFVALDERATTAFKVNARGRWQCNLNLLVRQRLDALGVEHVTSAGVCTHSQAAQCFSYRRDGRTGRMAALLWRQGAAPEGAC